MSRRIDNRPIPGYTLGMKTAISIPGDLFLEAERYARSTKKSRSGLFREALAEYLARHSPEAVTEAMNLACSESGQPADPFVARAARRTLERSEW